MTGAGKEDESTLASRGRARGATRIRRFRLQVLAGPDAGRELVVDESLPPRVLLGTSQACELRVTDREVSRRHAALTIDGAHLRVVDEGSTNGTFVGGLLVHDASLAGGETLRVGATTIRVLRDERDSLVSIPPASSFGRLQGTSDSMRRLFRLLERVARSDAAVVIEGEPGTGKQLCAEAIHAASARTAAPFVVFDCTAHAPEDLEPSLLGAGGAFDRARGGTLLLAEIGALDRAAQSKVHAALERTDVRLLVSTRRDLDRDVQEGRFREDLYFRVMIARVELPPLRARREDIGLLAASFWEASGAQGEIPREIADEWRAGPWPGNVRELENAVARLAALGDVRIGIGPRSVPPSADESTDPIERVLAMKLPLTASRELVVREFERRYVERVTAEHAGNVTHAARAAGVALRYFQLLRARLDQ